MGEPKKFGTRTEITVNVAVERAACEIRKRERERGRGRGQWVGEEIKQNMK